MKLVVRFRWLILAIWILAATLLAWKAPGMEKLVREKGQVTVPEGYPSTLASEIKKHHTNDKEGSESFIVVFHDKHKLDTEQIGTIQQTMQHIKNDQSNLESMTSQPILIKRN
jgi:putative drug exporter of the RND superfamily